MFLHPEGSLAGLQGRLTTSLHLRGLDWQSDGLLPQTISGEGAYELQSDISQPRILAEFVLFARKWPISPNSHRIIDVRG